MWNLIYSQSCFSNITAHDACTERKIFYRLISGAAVPRPPELPLHLKLLTLYKIAWCRFEYHWTEIIVHTKHSDAMPTFCQFTCSPFLLATLRLPLILAKSEVMHS